jgi:phytoene dehydrogenase-like protein
MISARRSYDVVILGSGIAGLAGALAAHALGLRPVVIEKAATLGGGTVHSYGLIWVGQNHLAQAAGHPDTRDEVLAYLALRDAAPDALRQPLLAMARSGRGDTITHLIPHDLFLGGDTRSIAAPCTRWKLRSKRLAARWMRRRLRHSGRQSGRQRCDA